jgi:hypothetical protein
MAKGDNNFIKSLMTENADLRYQLAEAQKAVVQLQTYLLSPKFQGSDNDYVHVSTDMLPKLGMLRTTLIQ